MFSGNERVDLHIHTTASDGSWSPNRLIKELVKKDIKIFSVTDHDSIANIIETQEFANKIGLTFIPGVEISATLNDHMFHILGYGIDIKNAKLSKLLEYNTKLMIKKDNDSIKKLIDNGYKIDFQSYLDYENDSSRGGWKALNYLIDEGHCRDAKDFFINLFKVPFPTFLNPHEVINTIHESNGYAVLAHPAGNMNGSLDLIETLDEFKNVGIDGIECYHPEHNDEKIQACLKWCYDNNLMITGGSDCHGGFINTRFLGFPSVYLKDLRIEALI